jgi:hypothetical protein
VWTMDFTHDSMAQGRKFRTLNLMDQGNLHRTRTRRVSTALRHMLTEFSECFHVSWTGLLIHASVGTAGGLGAFRTKRSG